MVGMFLKEREVQYTAHKDETTNTWRILDTWHQDLVNLGPEDEIPDDSPAVNIITEGAFIALVKEAARLGVLQNSNLGESGSIEEVEEFQGQISHLEDSINKARHEVPKVAPTPKSESFLLKERAMDTLLKITGMSDIENLAKD